MNTKQSSPVIQDAHWDRLEQLADLARDVLDRCRSCGAEQSEVGINDDRGLSVNVRMGEVETIEHTRDRGLSLTVFFGKRKGSASTADLDPESIQTTIRQACAIARHTEEDPCAGLAEPERMATVFPDFDLWHPWKLGAERAIALALEAEAAGRAADPRISNSDGSGVSSSSSMSVYANSHGFVGREHGTSHSISCSLIAGRGDAMQRDYWYDGGCSPDALQTPDAIGRIAAERTCARLDARPVGTGEYPVLFVSEVARSLFGHLLGAASGGALYRRSTFLLDRIGTQVLPASIDLIERPHLVRGHRSAAFDSEGVATHDNPLVVDGVLQRYILGSYSARKLGMVSTANSGGVRNLEVRVGPHDRDALIRGIPRGLLVTELMGQGVNIVTGDYSRGAAGFWIENGQISHAVDEVTIAGKLPEMLLAIEAIGNDIDRRSHIAIGSVLVGRMTVAGSA